MTQNETYRLVARRTGLAAHQLRVVFNGLFAVVAEKLAEGAKVPLGHVATCKLVHRPARRGRNPRTGEPLDIPAKRLVKISASATLKRAVNRNDT